MVANNPSSVFLKFNISPLILISKLTRPINTILCLKHFNSLSFILIIALYLLFLIKYNITSVDTELYLIKYFIILDGDGVFSSNNK
jgi:hypothetical protein